MTQTGHILTGIAIGSLCMPVSSTTKRKVAHLIAFMFLANIPDFPLKNWGHDRYDISHSILVNLLMIGSAAVVALALKHVHIRSGGWTVLLGATLAWLSHLLLDSFYNDGYGLALLWPVSDARLILSIPWFEVVDGLPPPITPQMIRASLIEFVSYFPLVIIAMLIRRARIARAKAA